MNGFSRWYHNQIATWALVFKQRDIAMDYWRRILDARPDDHAARGAIAHQLAASGKVDEALVEYEALCVAAPEDVTVWYNCAFVQQQLGAHGEAVKCFARAIKLNEKLDLAWYGQGLSYTELGEDDLAQKCFKETITLQPMSPYGFYEQTKLHHRNGREDDARRLIVRLKGFEPKWAARLEDETGIYVGVERFWVRT